MNNQIYNLYEYKYAKTLVNELPKIIKTLDQMVNDLANYTHYIDVISLIWELNQTSMLLQAKLEYYNNVYKNKGRI